jgi:mxaA protein
MLALVLAVMLAAAAGAGPRVEAVAVSEPRPFGYFLGDVVRREVILTLKPGSKLEPASIPQPGPLNYWLELRAVDVAQSEADGGTQVQITLSYQAFHAALDPRRLTIPGFTLKISDAEGQEDSKIPAFEFIVSPLREIFPGKESVPDNVLLQPDAQPRRLGTATERTGLLLASLTGLAALVLLAMHYAWWPFHRRQARPFTEAARFLRRRSTHLTGDGGYRAALITLHRAFDAAAGRRVLPDDVSGFVAEHPQFAPLSDDIERLFECSRTAFYGNDVSSARQALPIKEVATLGARLGMAERRAA